MQSIHVTESQTNTRVCNSTDGTVVRLEAHYESLRARHGYDTVEFGIGDIPPDRLARTFVAVDGDATDLTDDDTLLATGVGMTGPPHLGTVGQILTMTRLQRAGVDVQFVLADLEPYHGGHSLERVRALADRFRAFACDCGFDPDGGGDADGLRTQEEAREVMHTAQLLAPHYDASHRVETEATAWEDAVAEAYESAENDTDGPTSEAAAGHSAVLHRADFLHPLSHGYDRVVLGLGVDEHGLTPATRAFLAAVPDELATGEIAGLHARMITGLGDAPKMGRSLPGSAIHLGMAPERIRERLTGSAVDANRPNDSLAFQAMCLASNYDAAALDRIETACLEGGEEWERAKRDYATFACDLAVRWQAC